MSNKIQVQELLYLKRSLASLLKILRPHKLKVISIEAWFHIDESRYTNKYYYKLFDYTVND